MRYQIRHANVAYAADLILDDISFEIHDSEKIAVIGRNGCGKTTLLKLISGEISMSNLDSDEDCQITMAGAQKIGYLKQISFEDGSITVEQEIMKVFEPVFECERRMQELSEILQGASEKRLLNEYADLEARMESLCGYSYRQDMETVFQKFGFTLGDLKRPIGTLSGGQQTKVAFVKLLLSRPDIMLLDEPTNHLDMPTIEWLEGYLKNYNKAVVIVSHDRMFLDRVIDVTYEIEYHKMKRYKGNYTAFLGQKEEAYKKQEKEYEEQQAEIKRLTDWIEKWKNTPTKVAATRSKRKAIEHMDKVEKPRRFDAKVFQGQFVPRVASYAEVLNVKGLKVGYDSVLGTMSFLVRRGDKVAVIGENGKGKSTLLKTLVGIIPPLGGRYSYGGSVEWGYFDQQAAVEESAEPKKTVIEDFWEEFPTMKEVEVRNALGCFLFSKDEVFKELGQLSGGEKVRLALCKLFKHRPNLLILDEPTNHMDLAGKEALEKMLKSYTGTVLFVSHDRYFIREIATGIVSFEEGNVNYYPSGYEEYLENNKNIGKKDKAPELITAKGKAAPTLSDVFDKKVYYNPGKVRSRLKQQLEKYEGMLKESEERLLELQMQQMDPAYASDYAKLTKLDQAIAKEERKQESLLERMLETERELQKEGISSES